MCSRTRTQAEKEKIMAVHLDSIANLYAALARGDVPAVLAALPPDIIWTTAEGFPYGGTYVGPDAVLQNILAKLGSEWHGFAVVPHEYIASSDTAVALGEYSGTYKATGKSFKAPFVHIWKFDEDRIISFNQHTDTAVVQRVLQ